MLNDNKSKKGSEKSSFDFGEVMSKVKGLFQKKEAGDTSKNYRKVFTITRKDSLVSLCVSAVIIVGAVLYGMEVYNKYSEMNNNSEALRLLATYNQRTNSTLLSPYSDVKNIEKIDELIPVYDNLVEEIKNDESLVKDQKSYYEILLQNIYLPSLNVWKDPYTKNFDMTVLGQRYLENDKFQDLYLIQYRSDFVKYVGNDSDYNNIENITIGEKVDIEDSDYFYTPISVSFSSPNKRSFLLLVNKLSITSNQSNIALLNEFFFYLIRELKDKKKDNINKLMEKYWDVFTSSSDREFGTNMSELTEEEKTEYMNRVIGYDLYHWVSGENETSLIDDEIIKRAIRESALCNDTDTDQKCFYDFRDKYRDIPYLAYKVGLEKQANRTDGLLSFLRDLPPAIAIKDFWFEKYSNSSFLNNEEEQYEGQFTFNAYGRNITQEELEEASKKLGELCFGGGSDITISPETAVNRIDEAILIQGGNILSGGNREDLNVSTLGELKGLLTKIKDGYDNISNYEKMIKLFELWRMMNDANLCSQQ